MRNEEGSEEKFVRAQADINGYVASLGSEDAVVLEASAGALHGAEKIQSQGASCVVIDSYRFRIIRDSWQKTDKRDAANLSLALWLASRSGEMKLPEVWQPGPVVRELRRLFGLYELMNKQIRQLKNEIHGVLLDNGVRDRALSKRGELHGHAKDQLWETPLMLAAKYNQNPEMITTLLKAGADVNAKDTQLGWTPLVYAAQGNQNPELILTLLKAGADAKAKDERGQTALDYAKDNYALKGTDALKQLEESSK
ncbi:MAG: ankyrin repeat domain-containing protein [Spirochaetia bacterium]